MPDYRDLTTVRTVVRRWADLGYTTCLGVSPKHLGLTNSLGPTVDASNLAELLLDNDDPEQAIEVLKPRLQDSRITEKPYAIALSLLAEAPHRAGRTCDALRQLTPARRRGGEVGVSAASGR